MFGLLYGFWEYLFRKQELCVLILGLQNAGKTTLLERIKALFSNKPALPPSSIHPTVGLNIARVYLSGIQLILWDLGGQEELRSIWPKYYRDTSGVIFVVDASDTSPSLLSESRCELDGILSNPELGCVPLLIFCNKQDVEGASTTRTVAAALGLTEYHSPISDHHSSRLPKSTVTSTTISTYFQGHLIRLESVVALTGQGVREGVEWLVETAKEIKQSPEPPQIRIDPTRRNV